MNQFDLGVWILNYNYKEDHQHFVYTTEAKAEKAAVYLRRQHVAHAFAELIEPEFRVSDNDTNQRSDFTFKAFQETFTKNYTIWTENAWLSIQTAQDHQRLVKLILILHQFGPDHLSSKQINWFCSLNDTYELAIFIENLSVDDTELEIVIDSDIDTD